MPKWFLELPVGVRALCWAVVVAIGISPVFVAPGIAESAGLERWVGSNIGGAITIAFFLILIALGKLELRRRARHKIGEEIQRLAAPYRDDETDNQSER